MPPKIELKHRIYSFVLLIPLILFAVIRIFNTGVPVAADSKQWKFVVISDTQSDNNDKINKSCINDKIVRLIAEDIVKEKPEFVIISGDLINGWLKNNGTDYNVQYADWKKAMAAVYCAGIRVYPVRGNHDDSPERLALPPLPSHLEPPPDASLQLKKAFKEVFNESYIPQNGPACEQGLTYSFTHKNALIIGIDLYAGSQHKVNQEWLNRQLAGIKKLHIFIYAHEPAFETNHKDNLSYFSKDRDLFWDSIGKAGAKIYFCGHDHMYNRALIPDSAGNPVRQIIAGTGGGRLRAWSGAYKDSRVKGEYHNNDYHGYVLVTIDDRKITVAWKALINKGEEKSWQILDEFSIKD
ncbi:MAG: metallophosphoesterase [Spirochaetota bacterium]